MREEVGPQVVKAGVISRLIQMAERAQAAGGSLNMAFMSFTEPTLFHALCDLTKKGLPLDGFFDSKAGPPTGLGYRLESECQGPKGNNVRMFYMGMPKGDTTEWRLHHNKFFLTQTKDKVEMAFGSANLSRNGVSVNFENWNFLSAPARTPFVSDHICDLQAMRAARLAKSDQDDPDVFRAELEKCLTYKDTAPEQADRILKKDGVWALFSPDAQDRNFKILKAQIDQVVRGGRIRMAAYIFSHRQLAKALSKAQARGVTIELLIDDDIQHKKFYKEVLSPEISKFTTRVFDTNEQIFQMQHNKFLVFEGVGELGRTRVFAGAGQHTTWAFVGNYENFYLIETPELVRQFTALYDSVWALGAPVTP